MMDDDDDFFSRLPEDLIHRIVSFLSLKDEARMSPVSKSWLHRWKTCSNLDFNSHFIYPEEETSAGTRSKRKQLGYADWVNRILASHQGDNLDLLRIQSLNDYISCADIDRWIMFATQKQPQSLVIIVRPSYEDERCGRLLCRYILSQRLSLENMPRLKQLTLGNIRLGPFEFNCPNHLVSLTMDNVFISETWVNDMFRYCTHLKRLALLRCTSLSISKLLIPGHVRLQHLFLFHGLSYLRKVDLECSEDLESFECSSNFIKGFNFSKLRNLRKLILHIGSSSSSICGALEDDLLARLALDLPKLEHLQMGIDVFQDLHDKIYSQKTFNQLRFLSLNGFHYSSPAPLTEHVCFVLLRMSPILHTLELRGSFTYNANDTQKLPKRCLESYEIHQNLKVVRIHGFEHCQTAVDLVVFLVQNAANLKTIEINRRKQVYNMGEDSWADDAEHELQSSPEAFSEWFRTRVSSHTKLVVL